MKKADNANFCSQKKRTLQILRGTPFNCVLNTTKLYNRHYKTVYATNLGASMIQARSCARVRTLILKSHVSQIVTRLPSSHTSSTTACHHVNHSQHPPPQRSLATHGPPDNETRQPHAHPRHQCQRQRVHSTSPTATSHNPHHKQAGRAKYDNCQIDNLTQRRERVAKDSQHPRNDIDCPATTNTTNNSC